MPDLKIATFCEKWEKIKKNPNFVIKVLNIRISPIFFLIQKENGKMHPPPFSVFRKILHFQPLVKILALKTQFFQIFVPMTPHYSRKTRPLDLTFGKPCGTHPPKKLSAPPGIQVINLKRKI